jgi:hypothetical protein
VCDRLEGATGKLNLLDLQVRACARPGNSVFVEYRIILQLDIFSRLQSPGARQPVLALSEAIRPVQPVWLFF